MIFQWRLRFLLFRAQKASLHYYSPPPILLKGKICEDVRCFLDCEQRAFTLFKEAFQWPRSIKLLRGSIGSLHTPQLQQVALLSFSLFTTLTLSPSPGRIPY